MYLLLLSFLHVILEFVSGNDELLSGKELNVVTIPVGFSSSNQQISIKNDLVWFGFFHSTVYSLLLSPKFFGMLQDT